MKTFDCNCEKACIFLSFGNFSPGLVECNFDNLDKNFSLKAGSKPDFLKIYIFFEHFLENVLPDSCNAVLATLTKIFVKCLNKIKNMVFSKSVFIRKMFSGHRECNLDNTAEIFSLKVSHQERNFESNEKEAKCLQTTTLEN